MAVSFDLRKHTHLLAVAGSRAHGLHGPQSDIDLKGMAVPPKAWFLGFSRAFEQADDPSDVGVFVADLREDEQRVAADTGVEGSVYGLRKFMRLATAANPNVLEALFCRPEEIRLATPIGERLLSERERFLSAKCVQTFAGYASQQLARIQLHYRWHHDGPKAAPVRSDFDLPDASLIRPDHLEAAEAAVRKQLDHWELDLAALDLAARTRVLAGVARTLAQQGMASDASKWEAAARWVGLDDNLVDVMQRERAYRSARDEWRRYQGWKATRNPARAALEATHGYDTKHGAHLVRLLRMGMEIAQEGQCHVWRGGRDAEELTAIRGGAWTYDQLVAWSTEQARALRRLKPGDLAVPPRPDIEAIDALCVSLVEEALASGLGTQ
jgi:hypothetical protein